MPIDLEEAGTGGPNLVFADDMTGTEFQLLEAAVYDADEVSPADEVPEYGRWLKTMLIGQEEEAYMVGLGELLEELQRLEEPTHHRLEVTRCEKSGMSQTDPYEVNVEVVDNAQPAQERL